MFEQFSNIDRENLEKASSQLWELLLPYIEYLSLEDMDTVELAFITMVHGHGEQRRKSGEFYIIHPVAACMVLAKIGLERDTLAACLLHDVPEDTDISLRELDKNFSKEIVFLVEGVTKLGKIKYYGSPEYIENMQRMFVAMSKDLRVILIKLADRLHNLHTLEHVKPEKQQRIALESVEIYAPIAERLGISFFRGEIEDAAFNYLFPIEFDEYCTLTKLEYKLRQNDLENIKNKTNEILKKEIDIPFELKGRAKRYYSIHRKLQEKNKTIDSIYDLIAMRVVVDGLDDCYNVLAILHRYFTPVQDKFKDYIKTPKKNGYQSIHTIVKDESTGQIFEFQIRTEEMNKFAEYGVAAHWQYKDKRDFLHKSNLEWIGELIKLGSEDWAEGDYMKYVKLDLFKDRIFVLTPKDKPIDLPVGATPIDFAFKIHDAIGSTAVMAKINGKSSALDSTLKNGDIVEIITQKNQKPTRDWLNIVKTVNAARHIRQILRRSGEKFPEQRNLKKIQKTNKYLTKPTTKTTHKVKK
jgi:GTP diphosphokinase / guanosine-3',5'-bis(diphosphate) 3'-diphosphatase